MNRDVCRNRSRFPIHLQRTVDSRSGSETAFAKQIATENRRQRLRATRTKNQVCEGRWNLSELRCEGRIGGPLDVALQSLQLTRSNAKSWTFSRLVQR